MRKYNRKIVIFILISVAVSIINTQPSNKTYNIEGEDIAIYSGPGTKYAKIINQKATEILGETEYSTIDYTCKIIIIEENDLWAKVKVVEPDWLSLTHIGWIQKKYIVFSKNDKQVKNVTLDKNDYEIIKANNNSAVNNFHVLIKYKTFDEVKIFSFIEIFRNMYCKNSSNVYIYDSKSIINLIDKYPLSKNEYISLADHFVAMSSFDAPLVRSWYPYQDFQYKQYGGKNWKKKPLK